MYEKLEKICCDHWRDRTTDDLLSSNVFCTEGRFFPEGIYGIAFYGDVCCGHVLCDSDVIQNIKGASLGQLWTIGGRCAKGTHFTYWSAELNGRFGCVMAPYPGNELSF